MKASIKRKYGSKAAFDALLRDFDHATPTYGFDFVSTDAVRDVRKLLLAYRAERESFVKVEAKLRAAVKILNMLGDCSKYRLSGELSQDLEAMNTFLKLDHGNV